jgi:hypothetical protein
MLTSKYKLKIKEIVLDFLATKYGGIPVIVNKKSSFIKKQRN